MQQSQVLRSLRIYVILIVGFRAFGQAPPPSIKQDATNTSCSNIVALAGNATVNCSTLTQQQRKIIDGIPSVLNKILSNQLDPDAVMAKLDEIQKGVDEIRNAAADRTISDVDAQRLAAALLPFKGQKVSFTSVASDNETGRLARRILEILRAAQWAVPDQVSAAMIVGNGPLLGINITVKDQTPAALTLLNMLSPILPNVHGQLAPGLENDVITITVLSKR